MVPQKSLSQHVCESVCVSISISVWSAAMAHARNGKEKTSLVVSQRIVRGQEAPPTFHYAFHRSHKQTSTYTIYFSQHN